MGILLPGVQANSVAEGIQNAFQLDSWITGISLAVIFAAIVFGGVKRIAKFTELIVPFMAAGYIIAAIIIIAVDFDQLPGIISLIFKSAFNQEAGFGAVFGLAVQWGVKRGIYSNEAGQGSAPHIAAAANVSHPTKQGLVQAFSVYIDTLLVCTATGFMILITGTYNVQNPAFGNKGESEFLYTGLASVSPGAGYTQSAMDTVFPGYGSYFVAIALFFFAFTTILAYYYIAETNVSYLTRKLKSPFYNHLLRVIMILVIIYGSVNTAKLAWDIGDLGVGLMAWFNIIAILILQKPALAALKDYEKQRKAGKNPIFNPKDIGIDNAPLWEELYENRKL